MWALGGTPRGGTGGEEWQGETGHQAWEELHLVPGLVHHVVEGEPPGGINALQEEGAVKLNESLEPAAMP